MCAVPRARIAAAGPSSKFWRHRATPGGCGARDRRAGSLTPSGAPYPPYNGAGFVGWISAAHPPSASRPARCWRRPPKFGIADANQSHFLGADLTPDDLFTLEFLDIPAERLPNHYRNLIDASGTRIFDTWYG